MKTSLLALLVSSLLAAPALAQSAGSSSLNDPIYPFMGNGGYDAQDYNIRLRFAEDKKTLTGITTMQAVATQDLSRFNLDFGAMTVSNVIVNGAPARFSHSDPELTIVPNSSLKKGEPFRVSIVYSGAPSSKVGASSNFGQWILSPAGLTALAEPSLMFTWSPVNEHPSDKATFSLSLTSSQKDTAVSNGRFLSRINNKDGSATTSYRIYTPTSTYFVVLAVGDWKLETEPSVGNIKVRHYLAPGTTPVMRQAIAETGKIVDFYSQKLTPYPFGEAGVLTSDNDFGFALETQGLVTMPTSFGRGEDLIGNTEVVAHEFAHQWFGALVTFQTHKDIFIHEGFAEYLGWLYTAERFKDEVGPDYVPEKIANAYPNMVHGRYVEIVPQPALFQALKAQMGNKTLDQNATSTALELLFGKSLPAATRQQILAEVPQNGYSKDQFIAQLEKLSFTRVIAPLDSLYSLLRLSGREVPDFPAGWDAYTAPDRLEPGSDLFNLGVYERGAATLHVLRLQIGDTAFWKVLRGFLMQYKFSNASVDNWLEYVEKTAGKPAKDLQVRWLRDDVVPDFPELGLKASDFALGADFK